MLSEADLQHFVTMSLRKTSVNELADKRAVPSIGDVGEAVPAESEELDDDSDDCDRHAFEADGRAERQGNGGNINNGSNGALLVKHGLELLHGTKKEGRAKKGD